LYKILHAETLVPNIHLFEFDAPRIAAKARAGQFVSLIIDEKGERIPLTVADWERNAGTLTVIFMEVGKSTRQLGQLKTGDSIMSLSGPLGLPSYDENFGTVVCVAGGFAVAPIRPIARAMKEAGNRVISIMGARSKGLIFWEKELRGVSDRVIVTTDDGTYGRKGLVTEPLKEILQTEKVDRVIAIGPSVMMKFCALTTKPFNVKTIVSLNPIMVDGTGMCGCCRVEVDGKTKFACVDGPEFDGHLVDWNLLAARQTIYKNEEKKALENWECQCAKAEK